MFLTFRPVGRTPGCRLAAMKGGRGEALQHARQDPAVNYVNAFRLLNTANFCHVERFLACPGVLFVL